MSECFGCGEIHGPGETCAPTVSDWLIPVICLVPGPVFILVLAAARFAEWSLTW